MAHKVSLKMRHFQFWCTEVHTVVDTTLKVSIDLLKT